MKHSTHSDKKTFGYVYTFLKGYEKFEGKRIVSAILEDIRLFNDVGFCGFRSKSALGKHLNWSMFGRTKEHAEWPIFGNKEENKIVKIIQAAAIKCYKTVKCPHTLRLFVFPHNNSFVKERVQGVTGTSFWKNCATIFINPSESGWKRALTKTVCHEYAHAVQHNYSTWKTLLDGIIFEGLAEHFREAVVRGKHAPWSTALSEMEAAKFLVKLRPRLCSRSQKFYTEVFYRGKRYPLWTGYSIGYYIVKEYLAQFKTMEWDEIFRIPTKEIFEKSNLIS